MNFVVTVTVANKDLLERVIRRARPWEVLNVPQVGQDLIVAIKWRGEVLFFNLWQVTMVDIVDPDDGKDYRVETSLIGQGCPKIVTLNIWVTRVILHYLGNSLPIKSGRCQTSS